MKYLTPLFLLALFTIPPHAYAVDYYETVEGIGTEVYGDSETNLATFIGDVIAVLLGVLGVLTLLIMVYAGVLWMTAGGNKDQVDKAKAWLTNGAIGVAIIIFAYAISAYVVATLTAAGSGAAGSTEDDSSWTSF